MIYIITHKVFKRMTEDNNYRVLHVGNNDDYEEDYLLDKVGDSIAHKNLNYCELTGIYWLWKNCSLKNSDVIGICHYRRYFTSRWNYFLYTYFNIKPKILKYETIESELEDNDIIVPKPIKIWRTVKEYYSDVHYLKDLENTRIIIGKLYPEYLKEFDNTMNSHYYYFGNMMICKKEFFDEYCEWLFNILFELEIISDISSYDKYQSRIYGFLSERLLQVWINKNGLKIRTYPIFNVEEKPIKEFTIFKARIKKIYKKIRKHFVL